MENLLEQGGEFPEDLLFQTFGEPLPDAPWMTGAWVFALLRQSEARLRAERLW